MPKLTDFIRSMAEKAGIPKDDANLTAILGNDTIKDVEVDPAFSNTIDRNLLSVAAAKSNPDVRKALGDTIKAELYNGLDAELGEAMTELGFTEEQKTELLAEKSSTKRARLIAKKAKEFEAATHKDSSTADKKALQEKINELNNTISKIQNESTAALKAKDTELADRLLQKDIETDLLGFKYALPEKTPTSTKLAAAKDSINRRLAEKGLKVVVENGVKKLVRQDGTDYFDENHKAVSYSDFISGALAQDNLLLVSDDPQGEGSKTKFPDKVDDPENKTSNPSLLAAQDEDIAQLKGWGVN